MGQAFDLLGYPVRVKLLDYVYDASMYFLPPILGEALIGHFEGQGMLERVFKVGNSSVSYKNSPASRSATPPRVLAPTGW